MLLGSIEQQRKSQVWKALSIRANPLYTCWIYWLLAKSQWVFIASAVSASITVNKNQWLYVTRLFIYLHILRMPVCYKRACLLGWTGIHRRLGPPPQWDHLPDTGCLLAHSLHGFLSETNIVSLPPSLPPLLKPTRNRRPERSWWMRWWCLGATARPSVWSRSACHITKDRLSSVKHTSWACCLPHTILIPDSLHRWMKINTKLMGCNARCWLSCCKLISPHNERLQ